jgi:hypothetical protein
MTAETLAVLRIELLDTEPQVWRRVAVRGTTSLAALHKIIQAAMGWLDCHLWEFEVEGAAYGLADPGGMDWGRTVRRAGTIKLQKLIDAGIDAFGYVYDMGDSWEHQIVIERVEDAQPGQPYPQFLGGERRCPPEDCGGIPGYYNFLDDIAGPDKGRGSKRKKEALDWYGGPYDPDDINEEQIRLALKRIAGASRARKAASR